jgi:hypothetical protein
MTRDQKSQIEQLWTLLPNPTKGGRTVHKLVQVFFGGVTLLRQGWVGGHTLGGLIKPLTGGMQIPIHSGGLSFDWGCRAGGRTAAWGRKTVLGDAQERTGGGSFGEWRGDVLPFIVYLK